MENCIFCKIAKHEIPSQVVYEDDKIIAFKDLNPAAPVHVLIIPKKHISGIAAITADDNALVGEIMQVIRRLAAEASVADDGFRIVANQGLAAGQSVPHLHFHLLGGRKMNWPPG
jgi:histidine triad (HIT) family protein